MYNPVQTEIDALSLIWSALPSVSSQIPPPVELTEEQLADNPPPPKPTVLDAPAMFLASMKRAFETKEFKAKASEIVEQLLPAFHRAAFPNADLDDSNAAAQSVAEEEDELLKDSEEISLVDFAGIFFRQVVHPNWLPAVDVLAPVEADRALEPAVAPGTASSHGSSVHRSSSVRHNSMATPRTLASQSPINAYIIKAETHFVKQIRDLYVCVLDAPHLTIEPQLLPLDRVIALASSASPSATSSSSSKSEARESQQAQQQQQKATKTLPVDFHTFVELDQKCEYPQVYDDMWNAMIQFDKSNGTTPNINKTIAAAAEAAASDPKRVKKQLAAARLARIAAATSSSSTSSTTVAAQPVESKVVVNATAAATAAAGGDSLPSSSSAPVSTQQPQQQQQEQQKQEMNDEVSLEAFTEWFCLFMSFTIENSMGERSRTAAKHHFQEAYSIRLAFDLRQFRQSAQDLFLFYTKRLVPEIDSHCVRHFEDMMRIAKEEHNRQEGEGDQSIFSVRLLPSQSSVLSSEVIERIKFTTTDQLYAPDNTNSEEELEQNVFPKATVNRILVAGHEGLVSPTFCKKLAAALNVPNVSVLELLQQCYLADEKTQCNSQASLIRECIEQEKPIPIELQASLTRDFLNRESTKYRGYVFGDLPPALDGDVDWITTFVRHSRLAHTNGNETAPRIVLESVCPVEETLYGQIRAKHRDAVAASYSAELEIRDKEVAEVQARKDKLERKEAAKKRREEREERRQKVAAGELQALTEEEQEQEAQQEAEDSLLLEEEDVDPDSLDSDGNPLEPEQIPIAKAQKEAAKKRRSDLAEIERLFHASRTLDLSAKVGSPFQNIAPTTTTTTSSSTSHAEENKNALCRILDLAKETGRYLKLACFDEPQTLVDFTKNRLRLQPTVTPKIQSMPEDMLSSYESSPEADAQMAESFREELFTTQGLRKSRFGEYCPVTKFEDGGVLLQGTWFYSCSYREYAYCFATSAKLRKFVDNPHKYLCQDSNSRAPVLLCQEDLEVLSKAGISASELHAVLGDKLKLSCRTLDQFVDNWQRFDAETTRRAEIESARKATDAAEKKDREAREKAARSEADLVARKARGAKKSHSKTATKTVTSSSTRSKSKSKKSTVEEEKEEKEEEKKPETSPEDLAELERRKLQAQSSVAETVQTTDTKMQSRVESEKQRRLNAMRPLLISTLEKWNADDLRTFHSRHVLPEILVSFNYRKPVPVEGEEGFNNEQQQQQQDDEDLLDDEEQQQQPGGGGIVNCEDPKQSRRFWNKFLAELEEESANAINNEEMGGGGGGSGEQQPFKIVKINVYGLDLKLLVDMVLYAIREIGIRCDAAQGAGELVLEDEELDDELDEHDQPLPLRDPILRPVPKAVHQFGDTATYCPVSLVRDGMLVQGDPSLWIGLNGRKFMFANQANLDAFKLLPWRYIPRPAPSPAPLPPPRVWLIGPTSSGKDDLAKELIQEFNLARFSVEPEKLLAFLAAATNKPVYKRKTPTPGSTPTPGGERPEEEEEQQQQQEELNATAAATAAAGGSGVAEGDEEQPQQEEGEAAEGEESRGDSTTSANNNNNNVSNMVLVSEGGGEVDGVKIPSCDPSDPFLIEAIKIKKQLDDFSEDQKKKQAAKDQAEKDQAEREQWMDDGEDVPELSEAQQNAIQAALDWEPEDEELQVDRLNLAHRRLAASLSRIEPWKSRGYLLVGEPNNEGDLTGLLDAKMIPEVVVRLTLSVEAFLERKFQAELAKRQAEFEVKIRDYRMKQSALQLFSRVAEIHKWRRRNIGIDDSPIEPPELEDADNEPEPVDVEGVRGDLENIFNASNGDVETLVEILPERRIPVVTLKGDDGREALFASAKDELARQLRFRESLLENPEVITMDDAISRHASGRALLSVFQKQDIVQLFEARHGRHPDLRWAAKDGGKVLPISEEPAWVEPEPEVEEDESNRKKKKQQQKKEKKYKQPTKFVEDEEGNEIEVTDNDADPITDHDDEDEQEEEPEQEEPAEQEEEDIVEEQEEDPFQALEEVPELSPEEVDELQAELNAERKKRADRLGRKVCILRNRLYFFDNDTTLIKFLKENPRRYCEQTPPLPQLRHDGGNVVVVQAPADVLINDKSRTIESIANNLGSVFLSLPNLVSWGVSQTTFPALRDQAIAIALQRDPASADSEPHAPEHQQVDEQWIQNALACRLRCSDAQENGVVLCNLPRTPEQLDELLHPERSGLMIHNVLTFEGASDNLRSIAKKLSAETIRAVHVMKSQLSTSQALHEAHNIITATVESRRRVIIARELGFPLVVDAAALLEDHFLSSESRSPHYSYYCPWTWAREDRLLERNPSNSIASSFEGDRSSQRLGEPRRNVVEFLNQLYFFSNSKERIDEFLAFPERFIGHKFQPKALPNILPLRLGEQQEHDDDDDNSSSTEVSASAVAAAAAAAGVTEEDYELCGFCPVVLCDTRNNRGLCGLVEPKAIHGDSRYVVEYNGKYYKLSSEEATQRFLSEPWTFVAGAVLPAADQFPLDAQHGVSKSNQEQEQKQQQQQPEEAESLQTTSLEMYLRRALRESVAHAMAEVERVRPKFPNVSVQQSALRFIALHIRANHPDPQTEFALRVHSENYAKFVQLATMARDGGLVPPSENATEEEKNSFAERCRMWDSLLDDSKAWHEKFSGLHM